MVRSIHEIAPDGLTIRINWSKMGVGASVFVPCLDTEACKKELNLVTKQYDWDIISVVSVENQRLGVRMWRTA